MGGGWISRIGSTIVLGSLVSCAAEPAKQPATRIADRAPATLPTTAPNAIAVKIRVPGPAAEHRYDVRAFGAAGNGTTIDTDAINRAIDAAAAAGGGTVFFPAGTYASYSVRLKSNITLELSAGATLLAADAPAQGTPGGYDAAEPNPAGGNFQDFGHSHWHNSLIWGENLENIAIVGAGMIDGRGLGGASNGGGGRGGRGARGPATTQAGDNPADFQNDAGGARGGRGGRGGGGGARGGRGGGGGNGGMPAGTADKALGLKLCRNVTLRDVTFYRGGHFCILATGVDNMTVDNVRFDTNRDAFDVDSCRNVRISNCSINAPNDDGLVLKTSYALGEPRACENITITNCLVSGFEIGSLINATYQPLNRRVPDGAGPTGRIKLGTESNSPFRNITISNIVFDHCRGLALESVDGSVIEDISINNITMRTTSNSPIYLRLGARLRGPEGTTTVGALRRVNISDIVVHDADPRFASIISGIPDHRIEDVKLSNIRIDYRGGGTTEDAAREVPEYEEDYPEPQRMGTMPAYGFFIRHVSGIEMNNIDIRYNADEARPPFVLNDVKGVELNHVKAEPVPNAPLFILKNVEGFGTHQVRGVPDGVKEKVEDGKF